MVNIDDIKRVFRGHIALSEPLSKYTSIRIGGPADYYLEPADKEDTVAIIAFLQQQRFPFMIIGRGSNLLVSDEGIRGAVINLETGLSSIRVEGDRVYADAGVSMARFVDFCVQRGYKGMEMLAGIPGTLGGALIMNAGAYGGEISDHLVDVELLRNGALLYLRKEEVGFAYRRSGLQRDIILGASFRLPQGEKEEIMAIRKELLLKRNRAQPLNYPNSGSMFKNPPGQFAAKLIEEAGLKGARRGDAQVSEKHANFIVNLGAATAADVRALIELVRTTVFERFQIMLELEVKLLGFSNGVEKELHA
jgi:UDP-N-acetylmuramate dehydrogenase